MSKEPDKTREEEALRPLPDESLQGVAGGGNGEAGQPATETVRNDHAMQCTHYLSAYSPSVRLCTRCEFVRILEDLCPDIWAEDGLVVCEWVWYHDPRYRHYW
ncbi:MAG TPA: hypothetical protein VN366_04320 [Feifaniaceae bacterium]|nr:hypothetical protein [Feifaniaceae bacterium]